MDDYTRLKDYHTNRRHGDNAADCGDCRVGKCEVPDLVDALAAAEAREQRLREANNIFAGHLAKIAQRAGHADDASAGELHSRLYDIGYLAAYALQQGGEAGSAALAPDATEEG